MAARPYTLIGDLGAEGTCLVVKREQVLDFIMSRGFAPFTPTDIAASIACTEYQARGAVSWLKCGGFIKFHAWHETREHVKIYIWTGKKGLVSKVRQNVEEREDQVAGEKARSNNEAAIALQNVLDDMRRGSMLSIGVIAGKVKKCEQ